MPRDPGGEKHPSCGQNPLPCQTSTPNLMASDTKLSSDLGWISGLNANMATSHYQIHRGCKANSDSVGNMRADPILRKPFTPSLFVSLFPRLQA